MVAPIEALVAIPDSLKDVEAAPLLCAGITTYNALRHSGALPGDLVAVLGIGGLGHLSPPALLLRLDAVLLERSSPVVRATTLDRKSVCRERV